MPQYPYPRPPIITVDAQGNVIRTPEQKVGTIGPIPNSYMTPSLQGLPEAIPWQERWELPPPAVKLPDRAFKVGSSPLATIGKKVGSTLIGAIPGGRLGLGLLGRANQQLSRPTPLPPVGPPVGWGEPDQTIPESVNLNTLRNELILRAATRPPAVPRPRVTTTWAPSSVIVPWPGS